MSILSQITGCESERGTLLETDVDLLKEASDEARAWVEDVLAFFSWHDHYATCQTDLASYYLSVFGVEDMGCVAREERNACLRNMKDYRQNDFLLGIAARLIQVHGLNEGLRITDAFRRVWQAGFGS